MFVGEGQREGHRRGETKRGRGTKWERRGNERILIRNLKNKIIRLPDSKCQPREGSRWREQERVRQRGRKRKKGKERREKDEKRNIQNETGGVRVMETHPHHCSLHKEGIQSF